MKELIMKFRQKLFTIVHNLYFHCEFTCQAVQIKSLIMLLRQKLFTPQHLWGVVVNIAILILLFLHVRFLLCKTRSITRVSNICNDMFSIEMDAECFDVRVFSCPWLRALAQRLDHYTITERRTTVGEAHRTPIAHLCSLKKSSSSRRKSPRSRYTP